MKDSIRLSNTHGVNPAIPKCFFCLEDKNEIILAGKLPPLKDKDEHTIDSDPEAPRSMVWDVNPCDECKALMKRGVILISVRNGEEGDNPYRTGGWVVVTREAVMRMLPEDLAEHVCEVGMCFIEDISWDSMGLPRTSETATLPQETTE